MTTLTTLQTAALTRAHDEGGILYGSIHSSTRRSLLAKGLLSRLDSILLITDAGRAALGLPSPLVELPPPEYGFLGLENDSFKDLASRLGAVVGKPLMWARYLGADFAYQVCEGGKMEATKLDDGIWWSAFTPAYTREVPPLEA